MAEKKKIEKISNIELYTAAEELPYSTTPSNFIKPIQAMD